MISQTQIPGTEISFSEIRTVLSFQTESVLPLFSITCGSSSLNSPTILPLNCRGGNEGGASPEILFRQLLTCCVGKLSMNGIPLPKSTPYGSALTGSYNAGVILQVNLCISGFSAALASSKFAYCFCELGVWLNVLTNIWNGSCVTPYISCGMLFPHACITSSIVFPTSNIFSKIPMP